MSVAPLRTALVFLALAACGDDPEPIIDPPGPDGVPPEVGILYPSSDEAWDTDADGLMDVYISWSDEAGVDASTLRLDVVDGNGESLPGALALTAAWTVVEQTPTTLWLEETVEARLPSGSWSLRASVEDSTGTIGQASAGSYALPAFALHRSIPVGSGFLHGLSYCAPRDEVYVFGHFVAVVDARTFEVAQRALPSHESVSGLTCSGAGPLVVTDVDMMVLDVESLDWHDDGPAAMIAADFVLPAQEAGRYVASGYFLGPETGLALFRYDAASDQVTTLFPLDDAGLEASFQAGGLLIAEQDSVSVYPEWSTGSAAQETHDIPGTGPLADMAGSDDLLVVATMHPQSGSTIAAGADADALGVFWFEPVRVVDVAVSGDGVIFAPTTALCDPSISECEPIPAFAITGQCSWEGCVDRVPLPFEAGSLPPGDQAAFRSDDALLFWAAYDGDAPVLYVYLHRLRAAAPL